MSREFSDDPESIVSNDEGDSNNKRNMVYAAARVLLKNCACIAYIIVQYAARDLRYSSGKAIIQAPYTS